MSWVVGFQERRKKKNLAVLDVDFLFRLLLKVGSVVL